MPGGHWSGACLPACLSGSWSLKCISTSLFILLTVLTAHNEREGDKEKEAQQASHSSLYFPLSLAPSRTSHVTAAWRRAVLSISKTTCVSFAGRWNKKREDEQREQRFYCYISKYIQVLCYWICRTSLCQWASVHHTCRCKLQLRLLGIA